MNPNHQRSEDRKSWETPIPLFEYFDDKYHFDLDVCATANNAKCDRFFTQADNGLVKAWAPSTCWMNPPYGREIAEWVEKAAGEADMGATVVGLIPARVDTPWWHDYVSRAAEIYFIRHRIKFVGAPHNAPFPSAVAAWKPETMNPAVIDYVDFPPEYRGYGARR